MKKKFVRLISIFWLIVFTIVIIFYEYDMHNGKVLPISVYEELKDTKVFEGFFEQNMQEFFENSEIERQGEPISTPQQAKKLAQKMFYEEYGMHSVTTCRPYTVYHDDEAEMWLVYANSFINDLSPLIILGSGYAFLVTDNGYIIASFMW